MNTPTLKKKRTMIPQPDDSIILHLPRRATNRLVTTNVLIRMIRNAPGVQLRYLATPNRMGWVGVTKKAIIDRLRETGPNTLHAYEWNGAVVVLG
jgi:hypothetical protein